MADVRLHHPTLKTEITIPEDSVWVYRQSGWEPVEAEATPDPSVPTEPSPEAAESSGSSWGKRSKEQ